MRNPARIPELRIGLQQVAAGVIAGRRRVFVSTINAMRITFDPDKDRANQAKHGLSLSLAELMDWGGLLAKPDSRREYGELRVIGFVPDATGRLFCVVFTDRTDGRRIISLRKANLREVKLYAANDQN